MTRDVLGRLRWRLGLGGPEPVEAAAIAVAVQELEKADVDLPTWRRAAEGARDDADARDRYVRARVAALRRELRRGAGPLLAADRRDRARRAAELRRQAAAFRATPQGEAAYRAALSAALRGFGTFSLIYYAVVVLVIAAGSLIASC